MDEFLPALIFGMGFPDMKTWKEPDPIFWEIGIQKIDRRVDIL
jgi:hypothetical protein